MGIPEVAIQLLQADVQQQPERFGWTVEPLDTSEHDPVHVDDPAG